jgi:hypothetical protein
MVKAIMLNISTVQKISVALLLFVFFKMIASGVMVSKFFPKRKEVSVSI